MKNKIIRILPAITILALISFFCKIVYAQTAYENGATPESFSEPGAKLLITEVNFKNKEADWIELYYESPSRKPLNLKNFQFQDDTVFKKITDDFWISSNEYYLLEFKNAGDDSQQDHRLTTERTGLTATTEQIILNDPGGNAVDALCWSSPTPTADEIKDMDELFQNEGWVSASTSSCFPSANVSTSQSLIRMGFGDTDSINDWTVTDDTTPGKPNDETPVQQPAAATANTTISTETVRTEASSSPAGSSQFPPARPKTASPEKTPVPAKTTTQKSAAPKTSAPKKNAPAKKTTVKKTVAQKYKNGDLSGTVIISEIFPHAATDDRNNEWIELTNTGETGVNLGNWQLDDMEGGSKPYTLPDTVSIAPQSSILIKAPDSKLSLANTRDQVRLFDHAGTLLQTVDIEEAPKDQSYAWITVIRERGSTDDTATQEAGNGNGHLWIWENKPTPGEPNPVYLELTGTITQEATFGEKYTFVMKDGSGRDRTVLFNETLIAGPMAHATFTAGTAIKILGIETKEDPPLIELKKYEVTGTAEPRNEPSSPWMLMGLLPPGGAGFWYGLKKIKKIYGKI